MNRNHAAASISLKWLCLPPILFGIAAVASIAITDMILIPKGSLYFSREPVILASIFFPTALFSLLAAYLWLFRGVKLFRGWLSVAVAAWVPLLINPAAWVLVLASFFLYGLLVLVGILFMGLVLHISWERRVA